MSEEIERWVSDVLKADQAATKGTAAWRRHRVSVIRAAIDAGVPTTRIARELGISRQTVYIWLRDE